MGLFLAASAFRDRDVDQVTAALEQFLADHGWSTDGDPRSEDEVRLFAPVGGWTVVLWPPYFNGHDSIAARELSATLGTVASTVHIYDSDYWVHRLFRAGEELDRSASTPAYWAESEEEAIRLRAAWTGNAAVVADTVGRPAAGLEPYQTPLEDGDEPPGKAFDDDENELDDPWVFVDFWRRLGITYPADPTAWARQLWLKSGWLGQLPADGEL
jgi:hypothetical protein